jgi:hypothetical protein
LDLGRADFTTLLLDGLAMVLDLPSTLELPTLVELSVRLELTVVSLLPAHLVILRVGNGREEWHRKKRECRKPEGKHCSFHRASLPMGSIPSDLAVLSTHTDHRHAELFLQFKRLVAASTKLESERHTPVLVEAESSLDYWFWILRPVTCKKVGRSGFTLSLEHRKNKR